MDGEKLYDRVLRKILPRPVGEWFFRLAPSQRILLGLGVGYSGLILMAFGQMLIPK